MTEERKICWERFAEKILAIPLYIFTLGFFWVAEATQHDMTRDYSDELCLASYRSFRRAFLKKKWAYKPKFPDSLFAEFDNPRRLGTHGDCFHACIIIIDGTGYLLTGIGFLLAKRLRNEIIDQLRPLEKPTPFK